jgi:hypothetical protein
MDQQVGEEFTAGSQIRMLQQSTSWFAYDGATKVLPEPQHVTALWKANSEAHRKKKSERLLRLSNRRNQKAKAARGVRSHSFQGISLTGITLTG